jgi:hypothetical protein
MVLSFAVARSSSCAMTGSTSDWFAAAIATLTLFRDRQVVVHD